MYHRHYLVVFITYYFSRGYCYFKYLCLCLVDVNAYCTCAHISSTKYRAKEGRGYCEDFRLLSSYLVAIHCTIYFTFFFYCYSIYLLFYCYVNSLSTRSFSWFYVQLYLGKCLRNHHCALVRYDALMHNPRTLSNTGSVIFNPFPEGLNVTSGNPYLPVI